MNHSHKTTEQIGGKVLTLQTEYDRPSKYFDVTKFAEAGIKLSHAVILLTDCSGRVFGLSINTPCN